MKKRFMISYIAALIVALASPANADEQGSVLAPPDLANYGALSAKWWQWAASTPQSDNGPFSETGTNCGENQPSGHVFFLAGQFTDKPANRTCNIPAGKWLFLPVINTECSSLEKDSPFYGASVADRQACVNQDIFTFSELSATLDGENIVPEGQLDNYLVISPNFPIVAVPNNAALIPAGRGFSVSRGVWLLLAPLSPGEHTISFSGYFPAFDFGPAATYHITVE